MARRRGPKHCRHKSSGAPADGRKERHPLGIYGSDFDDTYAYIAGFTPGGAPYGVRWEEATYLKDCPEVVAWLGEAHCEALWGEAAMRARKAQRARLDRAADTDPALPY